MVMIAPLHRCQDWNGDRVSIKTLKLDYSPDIASPIPLLTQDCLHLGHSLMPMLFNLEILMVFGPSFRAGPTLFFKMDHDSLRSKLNLTHNTLGVISNGEKDYCCIKRLNNQECWIWNFTKSLPPSKFCYMCTKTTFNWPLNVLCFLNLITF